LYPFVSGNLDVSLRQLVEDEEGGRPNVVSKMSEENSSPISVEEAEEKVSARIPRRSLMLDHGTLDAHTLAHQFPGSGTDQDPYIFGWTANDPRNPLLFKDRRKWLRTLLVALANMAVALATSAYTAPSKELIRDFGISQEIFELGLSLFVLGFAFNAGCAAAPNIEVLLIMRFLAGTFGASPLTNAGGVVADIWPVRQRGLALVAYSSAPLFGPVIGPIIGGFLGEKQGWRWVQGFL